MGVLEDSTDRWSTLRDWVGDRPSHPLAHPEMPTEHLDAFEEIVALVVEASPEGWQGRRRAFRTMTKDSELWSQRVELLVASTMVRGGLSIALWDRPDVVVEDELGLEVTTRRTESDQALAQQMTWLEQRVARLTAEKAHQALDLPTILVVDVSAAGFAWLRHRRAWPAPLGRIVESQEHFVGLAVITSGYDLGVVREWTLVTRDAFQKPSCWERFVHALGHADPVEDAIW